MPRAGSAVWSGINHITRGVDVSEKMTISDKLMSKKTWSISIGADELRLESEDGKTDITVGRHEFPEYATVRKVIRHHALIIRKKPMLSIAIDEEVFNKLQEWRGPIDIRDLKWELKRAFRLSVIIGALLIAASLPLSGDPRHPGPEHSFDPVSLSLGVLLVINGLLARYKPDPLYLLADGVWFFMLSAGSAYAVYGHHGKLMAVAAVFQAAFCYQRLGAYQRLKHVSTKSRPVLDEV